MSSRGGARGSVVSGVLGALVLTVTVAVTTAPGSASVALPPDCASPADNVYRWTGGGASGSWDDAANWAHGAGNLPGAPDDGSGATSAVACIGPGQSVFLDGSGLHDAELAALHLDGATLEIRPGAGLFVNGAVPSQWSTGSVVTVTQGSLGGRGVIDLHGEVDLTSGPSAGAALGSALRPPGASYGGLAGSLLVEPDGLVRLGGGVSLATRYQLDVRGTVTVGPGSFVAADRGTATTVAPGGRLLLAGDGGYDQGFPLNGLPPSVLTNNGTLEKTGGTGTSVVDATYVQGPAAQVVVETGTLALPDTGVVSALVGAGAGLATGTCGGQATAVCAPTADPSLDPMSVQLTVPTTNGVPTGVQLQELAPVVVTVDSKTIGNEVLAHADQMVADPAHPATLVLRLSQADAMATPLDEVQVAHTSDTGGQTQLPDCAGGALPAGVPACVVRPVLRTGQNTVVTVLTTTTSRWHLRRNKPTAPGEQTAPAKPAVVRVKRDTHPFDGSTVKVSWSPPLDDGGAAVTAYRVFLDGKLVARTTKTLVRIKNPGPGLRRFKVAAVNALGEGARTVGRIDLPPLSVARRVAVLRGRAGGKLTAGVRWQPPASAGGLVVLGYQVAVEDRGGTLVAKVRVGAAGRRILLTLPPGSYRFQVRARNRGGSGPWSPWTGGVSPR